MFLVWSFICCVFIFVCRETKMMIRGHETKMITGEVARLLRRRSKKCQKREQACMYVSRVLYLCLYVCVTSGHKVVCLLLMFVFMWHENKSRDVVIYTSHLLYIKISFTIHCNHQDFFSPSHQTLFFRAWNHQDFFSPFSSHHHKAILLFSSSQSYSHQTLFFLSQLHLRII